MYCISGIMINMPVYADHNLAINQPNVKLVHVTVTKISVFIHTAGVKLGSTQITCTKVTIICNFFFSSFSPLTPNSVNFPPRCPNFYGGKPRSHEQRERSAGGPLFGTLCFRAVLKL